MRSSAAVPPMFGNSLFRATTVNTATGDTVLPVSSIKGYMTAARAVVAQIRAKGGDVELNPNDTAYRSLQALLDAITKLSTSGYVVAGYVE